MEKFRNSLNFEINWGFDEIGVAVYHLFLHSIPFFLHRIHFVHHAFLR